MITSVDSTMSMSDYTSPTNHPIPMPSFRLRIWDIIRHEFTEEQLESLHKYMKQPRRLSNPTPAALVSTAFQVVDDESILLDWNRKSVFTILEQWLRYQNRDDLAAKINCLAEEYGLAAQPGTVGRISQWQGGAHKRGSRRLSSQAVPTLKSVSEQADITEMSRSRSQSLGHQYSVFLPENDPELARWLEQLNAFDLKEYELKESPTHSRLKHPYRLNDLRVLRKKKPRHNTGLQPTKDYDGPGMRRDTSAKSLDSGYGSSVRSSMISSRESLFDCLSECSGNNLGSPERPGSVYSQDSLFLGNAQGVQASVFPSADIAKGITYKIKPPKASFPNQFPSLPFVKPTELLQFDAKGGEFHYANLGVSISVPERAVANDSFLCLEIGVCLYGPFDFPDNTTPIAPVLMLRPQSDTISLQKPITVTLPHIIVGATSNHIGPLEIQAVKAEHNRSTVSGHYVFRDINLQEASISLHKLDSEEYANINISHFCFISLRAKSSSEVAKKTGYCICPMIPTERGDVTTYHLPVIHCMKPWIEALQELFLKQGYTLDKNAVITRLTFRDVENAQIQGEIVDKEEGWSVRLISGDRKGVQVIAAKDVDDLWEKEQDQLEGELSLLLFPPRFTVIAIGTSATRDGFVTLRFNTTASITGEGQFEHINLPLTRSVSLPVREATEPPSLKMIYDNLKTIVKPIKFGVHLGISKHILDTFKEDNIGNLDGLNIALYTYMADNWQSLGLTWRRVANSLEHIHLGDCARKVRELDGTHLSASRIKESVNQHMHVPLPPKLESQASEPAVLPSVSRELQSQMKRFGSSQIGPTCISISGEIKIPLKKVFDDLSKNEAKAHISGPFPYDPKDTQYQLRFVSSNFVKSSCILYIDVTQACLQKMHNREETVTSLLTPDIELTATVSVTPPNDPEHRNITLNKAIEHFPSMRFRLLDYIKQDSPYATVSYFPNLLPHEKVLKYQSRQELEMVVSVTMTAVEY